MTKAQNNFPNRIARRAVISGARSEVRALAPVFEKSATELMHKHKTNLLRCKTTCNIATFNVRTLKTINQLPELTAAAANKNIDIICVQEHRFYHSDLELKYHETGHGWTFVSASAWKNTINADTGGVGMLLSPRALKSLNSIEKIQPRIICATFNGNPCTTIVSCYSPTNASDESDITTFYNELSSLARHTPKHNVLIIGGDMNAQIGKDNNNKFSFHSLPNRNGEHLAEFSLENGLVCLNTKYQKRKGKMWTYTYPNSTKAQLDYILLNKKWINSAMNCEAYSSFEGVSTDHRIVTAKIRLSLRKNKKQTGKTVRYDWSTLANNDICEHYSVTVRNKFNILQETGERHSPNDEYENFVTAHLEAAAKHIPTKQRAKHTAPWETKEVREKRENVKKASLRNKKNQTNTNRQNLKKAQVELAKTYKKEQLGYIQNQINKIRISVEDRQARLAWQTVNEISGRKSAPSSKLKAASQEDRLLKWKEHFKNLLGNPPKITDKNIQKISNSQLDIKLGHFTIDELETVLRAIKNRKAAGLDEVPPEVWKSRKFDDILLRLCNAVYTQNAIEKWTKGCILPFPKKGDLGIAKNYRGITLTAIAAKVYNALLLNRIRPEVEKILRKNQNGFRRNRSTTSQILTVRRIVEGVRAKNLEATLLFVDFSKAFDSIHRGKMEQILLAYGLPKETVAAVMMLYKDTRALVRSPDGDTDYFDIVAGVLQGDTLAPFLFIICLDYVLRTSLDLIKEKGFTLKKGKEQTVPSRNYHRCRLRR